MEAESKAVADLRDHRKRYAISGPELVELQVKGKPVCVPSVFIQERRVIIRGKWLRIASVMDEDLVDGQTIADPESFLFQLKRASVKADIFTFAQKLPAVIPAHNYHYEWDNIAVVPTASFAYWWENRAHSSVRKAVKRAQRLGVVVKVAELDDQFVQGIRGIYNEVPIRQGRHFWHYQKDFETVKRENSTYLERSTFIGAYFNDELIGFIRMVYAGGVANTLQVISQMKHYDKKTTNALIAKAVEVCQIQAASHLIYGQYTYSGQNSSLTEFKRRNGFEQVLLPRYYIPLTAKGSVALKLNLHRRLASRIPEPVLAQLRKIRNSLQRRKIRTLTEAF